MRILSALDARNGHEVYAVTDYDDPGACVITWVTPGEEETVSCDGWIEGDRLFAPAEGTDPPGSNLNEEGLPDPNARWYDVESGRPALCGVAGVPLSVLL